MKITKKELTKILKNFSHLDIGEFTRINHNTSYCSGSSKSMKIERKDDGSLYCKCHRCDGWGYIGGSKFYRTERKTKPKPSLTVEKPTIPKCATKELGIKAKVWLNKYEITKREIKGYGLLFNPMHNSLILPVFDTEGTLTGYQERNFDPSRPKYTTTTWDRTKMFFHTSAFPTTDRIVIVEDVISAIKVGRIADTLALLGTSLNDEALLFASQWQKAVVWLDNDNKQVKMNAMRIANKVSSVINNVCIIRTEGNPKELSESKIKNTLYL